MKVMRAAHFFAGGLLAFYSLLVIAPVVAFLLSAFEEGMLARSLPQLWNALTRLDLLRNSLTLSALTALAATGLGVPIGYVLARTDVRGRWALMGLCALPLFLPAFLWATAWQAGLRAHGMTGMAGAVLAMTLSLYPIVVFLAGLGFAHVGPALEDDVRTLGSETQVWWHVALPLARPLITTGFLVVFVLTLAEFGVPALMEVSVYPVAVYTAFSAFYDFGQAAVLCLPLVTLVAILVGVIEHTVRGLDVASLTDPAPARNIRLRKWRTGVSLGLGVLLLSLVTVPLGTVLLKADASGLWADVRSSLWWSMILSAVSVMLLLVMGLPMAWVCQRGYVPAARWWRVIQLPLFALPSTVIGLGLVGLYNRPVSAVIYGTIGMIVLGHLARFLPLTVCALDAFLAQIPRDCEEAVWVDGGTAWQAFLYVVLPGARWPLVMTGALAFVLCLGELAVSILVAPPGIQTLAVRLFTIEANAPVARTAGVAVVLAAAGLLSWLGCMALLSRRNGT